jgi:hypothetical protein
MKCLAAVSVGFALALPFSVSAEEITAYTVHMELAKDGSVAVQEEILYDFGDHAIDRHGIFRDIPLVYRSPLSNTEKTISIVNITVTDGAGTLLPVKMSGNGLGGNSISLRIGDPDTLIEGEHLYVIRYTVWDALEAGEDQDILYWNAIGTDWGVPIRRAKAEVVLPTPLPRGDVDAWCYSGDLGSRDQCPVFAVEVATNTVTMMRFATDGIAPHFGLTIALGIPKGFIDLRSAPPYERVDRMAPPWWERDLVDLSLLLPMILLILLGSERYRRIRSRQDQPIIVSFEPPGSLSPMEAEFLRSGRCTYRSLTAMIVILAANKSLGISLPETASVLSVLKEKDLVIRPLDRPKDGSALQRFWNLLFIFKGSKGEIRTAGDTERLRVILSTLRTFVVADLFEKGLLRGDPVSLRLPWVVAGIALALLSLVPGVPIGVFVSGIMLIAWGIVLPFRTPEGDRERERLLGYIRYLEIAEKQRIAFHGAPEQTQALFEEHLPYAIALGLEKEWVRYFDDVPRVQSPAWSNSAKGSPTTITATIETLEWITSSIHRSMAVSPTRGGGVVGGGRGGGGDGSW